MTEQTMSVKELMDYLKKFPKNATVIIEGLDCAVGASQVIYDEDSNEVIIRSEYSL